MTTSASILDMFISGAEQLTLIVVGGVTFGVVMDIFAPRNDKPSRREEPTIRRPRASDTISEP